MGIVFDAIGPDGQQVALKTIQPARDEARFEQVTARFAREARILKQLDHPGIVHLIDAGQDGDVLYLAMERVEGISLLALRRQGPLGFQPLVQLGIRVGQALAHLHDAGVIHRDIKPANILVRNHGQPVITDFGISGLNAAANITRQGDLLGSPGFMAPEVVEGRATTPASDQFSLGRLLFELGARGEARRLPRDRPLIEVLESALQVDWRRLPTDEPWPALERILRRMMAPEPADRFEHSRAVVSTLRQLLGPDGLESDTLSDHIQRLESTESLPEGADDALEALSSATEKTAFDDRLPAALTEVSAETAPAAPAPFEDPNPILGEAADRPPTLRLPPSSGARYDDPKQGIPLDALVAQRQQRARPSVADRPITPAPEPSELETASRAPAAGEITQLQRTNRRLAQELAELRRRQRRPRSYVRVAIAATATFAIGLIIGVLSANPAVPPPIVVRVPGPPSSAMTAALPAPEPGADEALQNRTDAHELLRAAYERLHQKDVDGALRLLRLCTQVGALPECHRDLGSVLALIGDPRARQFFEQYLADAPNAIDAPAIREALTAP